MDRSRINPSLGSPQTQLQSNSKQLDRKTFFFNQQKAQLVQNAQSPIRTQTSAYEQTRSRLQKELAQRKFYAVREAMEKNILSTTALADQYAKKFGQQQAATILKSLLNYIKGFKQNNAQDLLKAIAQYFSDVSDQYEALAFAEEALLLEGEIELAQMVAEAKAQLMEEKGPQVRAGINILADAQQSEQEGLSNTNDLRDFYRDTLLNQEGLASLYRALKTEYGGNKIREGLDFLLKASTSDLQAQTPSIEKNHLRVIMDNFYQVGVIHNIQLQLTNLMNRMQKNFGDSISHDIEWLMEQIFQLVEALRVEFGVIINLSQHMGAKELNWQIYFLTGLYEQLRLLPKKIYPTNDHRDRLLSATQDALDHSIAEEENATDDSETHESS